MVANKKLDRSLVFSTIFAAFISHSSLNIQVQLLMEKNARSGPEKIADCECKAPCTPK